MGLAGMESIAREVRLLRERVENWNEYPFKLPAVHDLTTLHVDEKVTIFVGENGSGKSTLVEAIAIAARFNAEGGTRNFNFAERPSESRLHEYWRFVRGVREQKSGFCLRAESFFNVATEVERLGLGQYGWKHTHNMSHGEGFLYLIKDRFRSDGLSILDEPESALSPKRQLSLLRRMFELTEEGSQFIFATHSPILMAFPDALIYEVSTNGVREAHYDDIEHVSVTRDFLQNREAFLRHLRAGIGDDEDSLSARCTR